MRLVDLHMHSNFSDGLLEPESLIDLALKSGLSAIALTDHDNVSGLMRAEKYCRHKGLELVPGVEISVSYREKEIHILGYFPRILSLLESFLAEMRAERFKRMAKAVLKLKERGFKLELDEVLALAGQAAPGRLHLARLLVTKKYVSSPEQAFKLYLGQGKPGYVARNLPTVHQAMDLLKEAAAIPVIAHPGLEGKTMIGELEELGLMGIEVFHPEHNVGLRKYYHELASQKGLAITGGSDFHGEWDQIDHYSSEYAIDEQYLKLLKKLIY